MRSLSAARSAWPGSRTTLAQACAVVIRMRPPAAIGRRGRSKSTEMVWFMLSSGHPLALAVARVLPRAARHHVAHDHHGVPDVRMRQVQRREAETQQVGLAEI